MCGNISFSKTLTDVTRPTRTPFNGSLSTNVAARFLLGGREIAAFEKGREFLGQDPNCFF